MAASNVESSVQAPASPRRPAPLEAVERDASSSIDDLEQQLKKYEQLMSLALKHAPQNALIPAANGAGSSGGRSTGNQFTKALQQVTNDRPSPIRDRLEKAARKFEMFSSMHDEALGAPPPPPVFPDATAERNPPPPPPPTFDAARRAAAPLLLAAALRRVFGDGRRRAFGALLHVGLRRRRRATAVPLVRACRRALGAAPLRGGFRAIVVSAAAATARPAPAPDATPLRARAARRLLRRLRAARLRSAFATWRVESASLGRRDGDVVAASSTLRRALRRWSHLAASRALRRWRDTTRTVSRLDDAAARARTDLEALKALHALEISAGRARRSALGAAVAAWKPKPAAPVGSRPARRLRVAAAALALAACVAASGGALVRRGERDWGERACVTFPGT